MGVEIKWRVFCDNCREYGPVSRRSEQEAEDKARRKGWQWIQVHYCGIRVVFCKECSDRMTICDFCGLRAEDGDFCGVCGGNCRHEKKDKWGTCLVCGMDEDGKRKTAGGAI